jgi:hypothetical protein
MSEDHDSDRPTGTDEGSGAAKVTVGALRTLASLRRGRDEAAEAIVKPKREREAQARRLQEILEPLTRSSQEGTIGGSPKTPRYPVELHEEGNAPETIVLSLHSAGRVAKMHQGVAKVGSEAFHVAALPGSTKQGFADNGSLLSRLSGQQGESDSRTINPEDFQQQEYALELRAGFGLPDEPPSDGEPVQEGPIAYIFDPGTIALPGEGSSYELVGPGHAEFNSVMNLLEGLGSAMRQKSPQSPPQPQ